MVAIPVDEVGCMCRVISGEHEERTKQNAGHELEAQNEDLKRKMSEDFDISQEETSFPLLK